MGINYEEVKEMSEAQINEIVALISLLQATANDVDWVAKVRMQGAIQKWVDHSSALPSTFLPRSRKSSSPNSISPRGRRDARAPPSIVTDQGPACWCQTARRRRRTTGRHSDPRCLRLM